MVAVAELPDSGFVIEVDGLMKTRFATSDGAKAGAEELKRRFTRLCIRIFDAQSNARQGIQLRA
jgi:hypothetical protein